MCAVFNAFTSSAYIHRLLAVQYAKSINPHTGNGFLATYTGNGGGVKLPPRAFNVM